MRSSISLGRILGIPVGVSYTWFIILALVSYIVFGQLSLQLPRWGAFPLVGLAGATGLLFFGSILAHELAHSVMATRHSLPVRGITLFLLGGVSHITRGVEAALDRVYRCLCWPAAQPGYRRRLAGHRLSCGPRVPHRTPAGGRHSGYPVAGVDQPRPWPVQSAARLSAGRRPCSSSGSYGASRATTGWLPASLSCWDRPSQLY